MRRVLSLALALFVAGVATGMAENYPSRPITIVVPFPAGGPTDALARVLAERMKGALGQSVIVENPTGAAGTIGTGRVAPYAVQLDVVKFWEPISLVADCPVWFVAKAALPPKDLRELVAWMKENP